MSRHAVMTDQMLAEIRSEIGKTWKVSGDAMFNHWAAEDPIRHFCNSIGDINPLFRDREYAANTKYGCIIAPPTYLYAVYWSSGHVTGFKGIHGWHSGNEWEFFKPIKVGTRFEVEQTITRVDEKRGRMANRIWISHGDSEYRDQNGELVARTDGWTTWAERGEAGKNEKYAGITEHTYTPEELTEIEELVLNEEIRGATPRYWEDVNVGDKLGPVVKGPLALRDLMCYLQGLPSPYIKAHGIWTRYTRRHPAVGMVDEATGRVDAPELVHQESTRAKEIGIPGAYDYGCQRMSWLGSLLTNWMGDDGFVKKLYGEVRRFNCIGDTTYCEGKVKRKYVEGDQHYVEVEIWARNQRDEITAPGWAIVELPSQAAQQA